MSCPNRKPPFRLEGVDRVYEKSKARMFHTKNCYQPTVKVTDWEKQLESAPIDNDPYCPGNLNYFLSHYNHLGNSPNEPYVSTTSSAFNQIHLKEKEDHLYNNNPNKYMVNYLSYKDTSSCESGLTRIFPKTCTESYETTMQKSYKPPYPYVMQGVTSSQTPFLQNRKFKWSQDPTLSKCKFYDDGLNSEIKQIQEIKGFRSKSYDPLRLINTDGSIPFERKQICAELEFKNKVK